MSNKHSRQKSNSHAKDISGTDDLKLINGISATLEQRLHRVGVLTYVQLSQLTPGEVAKLLGNPEGLKERAIKQDWVEQARELAESKDRKTNLGKTPGAKTDAGDQTYEAFAVELMIGSEREVIHTRVMQVSSGDEEIWGGWQEKRLADFFVKRANLLFIPIETPPVETPAAALVESAVISALAPSPTENATDVPDVMDTQENKPVTEEEVSDEVMGDVAKETAQITIVQGAIEQDQMKTNQPNKLEIISETGTPTRILQHGQPFRARLSLNLAELALLGTDTFAYTVTLIAHNLGGEKKSQTLGYKKDEMNLSQSSVLELNNLILPLGGYRLEAAVTVNKPMASCCGFQLQVSGGMLQVY